MTHLLLFLSLFTLSAFAQPAPEAVLCAGRYPSHLQGVCVGADGSVFWSWTDRMVKTDPTGQVLHDIPADDHHGDLCHLDGKVYVAVNLGKFNEPPGREDSWVYVYDAATLKETARHRVPELVHGAGGIATDGQRFLVVGGLPPDVPENYLYEYDLDFKFVQRHVLASGHTHKGIQTATWAHGAWWFGCYGTPKILLRASPDLRLTGKWETDASLGLEALPDGRLLIGRNLKKTGAGHQGWTEIARPDPEQGLIIEKRPPGAPSKNP